jgi:hypothetical protein
LKFTEEKCPIYSTAKRNWLFRRMAIIRFRSQVLPRDKQSQSRRCSRLLNLATVREPQNKQQLTIHPLALMPLPKSESAIVKAKALASFSLLIWQVRSALQTRRATTGNFVWKELKSIRVYSP